MNSVNRVRPVVQFQCISQRPCVYVEIVREPGKPINHKAQCKSVVEESWNKFNSEGIKARQPKEERYDVKK